MRKMGLIIPENAIFPSLHAWKMQKKWRGLWRKDFRSLMEKLRSTVLEQPSEVTQVLAQWRCFSGEADELHKQTGPFADKIKNEMCGGKSCECMISVFREVCCCEALEQ